MCGIAGFTTNNKLPNDVLMSIASSMAEKIKHRGPDAQAVWTDADAGIALSHRRLSIVDLSSTGNQPMVSHTGDWVIVYNGEIYNTEELRHELKHQSIPWRGTSDTEVIVEAINHWGVTKTVKKLIGMFAFAAWNRRTRILTLVRDRLGIKPLYWSKTSTCLIFGSELKALRSHPDCPTSLNRSSIANHLRNCYINNPATIYKDINQLQPGWLTHWDSVNNTQKFEQYWALKDVASNGHVNQIQCSDSEAIAQLDDLLGDAVKRRMVADVPLGAFLSGGVDSSIVVAQMQKFSDRPVKTFSIGFEDPKYDESAYAASIADHLKTDHKRLIMTASDALNVIPDLPTMFDEPFSDASQIPTYLVSRMTREHVTVALSGDGGDELFAGYQRYFDAIKYNFLISQPKAVRNMEAWALDKLTPEILKNISWMLPGSMGKKLTGSKLQRIPPLLRDGSALSLYRQIMSRVDCPGDILLDCEEPPYEKWELANALDLGQDRYSLMQFIDTIDYLPDDILTKVDRASMAVSLEARVPILDHRLVEFAWRLPENQKVRNGSGKWLLRNLLYQYVPKELIDRPKKGFGVPVGSWLRGPLREWANDLLSTESLNKTHIFKQKPIQKKLQQHMDNEINWDLHLWDVLSLQAWTLENG